jgi:cytochrome c biogenesis protein CcmG, thiol:disulfide interchange protein DsbE
MRRRVAAALVAAGTVLAGCTSFSEADEPSPTGSEQPVASAFAECPEQPDEPAAGGSAVPQLAFDCLGGGSLDLTRAPGVPTVVNLWGSWCAPCRDELPVLQEFADAAEDRVRVVGVVSKDGEPQAESFGDDAGVTFPNAFDGEGELMAELGLNALPFTMFLDADGTLVHSELGPVESLEELEQLVAEHLGVRL